MIPQTIETGRVTQKGWVAAWVRLVVAQRLLSNCIGHPCWLLVFSFPFWFRISPLVSIIINNNTTNITPYLILVPDLFSSPPTGFTFSHSPPHATQVLSKWLLVLSSRLALNTDPVLAPLLWQQGLDVCTLGAWLFVCSWSWKQHYWAQEAQLPSVAGAGAELAKGRGGPATAPVLALLLWEHRGCHGHCRSQDSAGVARAHQLLPTFRNARVGFWALPAPARAFATFQELKRVIQCCQN